MGTHVSLIHVLNILSDIQLLPDSGGNNCTMELSSRKVFTINYSPQNVCINQNLEEIKGLYFFIQHKGILHNIAYFLVYSPLQVVFQ